MELSCGAIHHRVEEKLIYQATLTNGILPAGERYIRMPCGRILGILEEYFFVREDFQQTSFAGPADTRVGNYAKQISCSGESVYGRDTSRLQQIC